MKPINYLIIYAFILIVAELKYPSIAVALPLCFALVAIVVVSYLDIEENKKIKDVEKRITQIESDFKSLKSSMSLKNL